MNDRITEGQVDVAARVIFNLTCRPPTTISDRRWQLLCIDADEMDTPRPCYALAEAILQAAAQPASERLD